ncbi:hypothetical protein QEN19_004360 [Hanseniaspora menglaensis]
MATLSATIDSLVDVDALILNKSNEQIFRLNPDVLQIHSRPLSKYEDSDLEALEINPVNKSNIDKETISLNCELKLMNSERMLIDAIDWTKSDTITESPT